jgi:hypothetical protein
MEAVGDIVGQPEALMPLERRLVLQHSHRAIGGIPESDVNPAHQLRIVERGSGHLQA